MGIHSCCLRFVFHIVPCCNIVSIGRITGRVCEFSPVAVGLIFLKRGKWKRFKELGGPAVTSVCGAKEEMVINDSFFLDGWLADGWKDRGTKLMKQRFHYQTPPSKTGVRVGVFEWVAASHILLIHLVHLGNDSLTFALEEKGKMLPGAIGNVFSQIQTRLTSPVLCFFKAKLSKYFTRSHHNY